MDEVGYDRIQRDDGGHDTVLTYRYVYHTDLAISEDGSGLTRQLDFTIVIEDFGSRFSADWITLA